MSPSPCCQPKSADARFGMALSCIWACAAAPAAREAISAALQRKAVLDIASSSVTKFQSSVWQMPLYLAFFRLPFDCLCTITPLGARYPTARCRRGVEGDRTGIPEPAGVKVPLSAVRGYSRLAALRLAVG